MPTPTRTERNYRIYRLEHLHRLQFVRRCRDLGFTLNQLRDLLRLSVESRRRCSGIDRITENHLKEIEAKSPTCDGLRRNCAASRTVVLEEVALPTAASSPRSRRLKGKACAATY